MGFDGSKVSEMIGKTMISVEVLGNEEIVFTANTGEKWRLFHQQDCCESVLIEDICGDVGDLVGSPITMADESTNSGEAENFDSCTWTFYRFATVKGYVTVRWYGTSNGYYSESVDFERVYQ